MAVHFTWKHTLMYSVTVQLAWVSSMQSLLPAAICTFVIDSGNECSLCHCVFPLHIFHVYTKKQCTDLTHTICSSHMQERVAHHAYILILLNFISLLYMESCLIFSYVHLCHITYRQTDAGLQDVLIQCSISSWSIAANSSQEKYILTSSFVWVVWQTHCFLPQPHLAVFSWSEHHSPQ